MLSAATFSGRSCLYPTKVSSQRKTRPCAVRKRAPYRERWLLDAALGVLSDHSPNGSSSLPAPAKIGGTGVLGSVAGGTGVVVLGAEASEVAAPAGEGGLRSRRHPPATHSDTPRAALSTE